MTNTIKKTKCFFYFGFNPIEVVKQVCKQDWVGSLGVGIGFRLIWTFMYLQKLGQADLVLRIKILGSFGLSNFYICINLKSIYISLSFRLHQELDIFRLKYSPCFSAYHNHLKCSYFYSSNFVWLQFTRIMP